MVNNSGVTWGAPFDNFPEKEGWDRVLGVNVKSIFYSKLLRFSILCTTIESDSLHPGYAQLLLGTTFSYTTA